jgi:co-chaperonin GroES (HSP10)
MMRELGWRGPKGPQEANKSGFRATGHRLLLSPDIVEETTASGILLPKKAVKAEQDLAVVATVIEVGYDAWRDKFADYCAVGDRVLIGQYAGKFHESPVDGKLYRFVNDLDVISPINV